MPVLHGGELVGIVSLRDLHLIETLPGVEAAQVSVEDNEVEGVFTTVDALRALDDALGASSSLGPRERTCTPRSVEASDVLCVPLGTFAPFAAFCPRAREGAGRASS
jgi:hypothetical protein